MGQVEVVEAVRDLVEQENAWLERCKQTHDALDLEGQVDFKEVFRVLTAVPLSDEELSFYIRIEAWDTLEENKELMGLRDKWLVYLNEDELPHAES